jgi:tetratricopeptide (TPR) repeat protein
MLKAMLVYLALLMGTLGALADEKQDCTQQHDLDLSIHTCTDILLRDAGAGWAYAGRGIAYFFRGDAARAIADFDKAIEVNPRDALAFNDRARV